MPTRETKNHFSGPLCRNNQNLIIVLRIRRAVPAFWNLKIVEIHNHQVPSQLKDISRSEPYTLHHNSFIEGRVKTHVAFSQSKIIFEWSVRDAVFRIYIRMTLNALRLFLNPRENYVVNGRIGVCGFTQRKPLSADAGALCGSSI